MATLCLCLLGGGSARADVAIATTLLAGLTGYAARTGPPVPTWFMVSPLLGAALVGLALFAMDARGLRGTVLLRLEKLAKGLQANPKA